MSVTEEDLKAAKKRLLRLHHETNTGHIGGNFSCIEALFTLYHKVLNEDDLFVLSKGHSAAALYVTLWSKGLISEEELKEFNNNPTRLPAHPCGTYVPGVLFSTGSLGHGPSLASGLALSLKDDNSNNRVFCLCSDGEWQEGSCWEALIFAVHQKLSNLTILIDQNRLQGFGKTREVVSFDDLTERITSFGALTTSVDGHSCSEIVEACRQSHPEKPHIVILNTDKGRGLHFSGEIRSHYLPLSEQEYQYAVEFIDNELVRL